MSGGTGKISNPINYFKEKLILQEEEKQLKKMLEKFQDQQNRLKIEELALISMMKMEKEKGERSHHHHQSATSSRTISSVTSSEMKDFAPVGVMTEDACVINQQVLDLNLEPSGHFARGPVDDEEEMDSEEEEQQAKAVAAAESHQLMSFMEDF